jgi:hypothetical protein
MITDAAIKAVAKAMALTMDQTHVDGLIAHEVLEQFKAPVVRIDEELKKAKKNPRVTVQVSLYDMTDDEFLTWVVTQIDGIDNRNRLRFRMFLLAGLQQLCGLKDLHWKTGA